MATRNEVHRLVDAVPDDQLTAVGEVLRTEHEVLVRNSNRPDETPQRFTYTEWESFTQGAKLGTFDLPTCR